MEKEGKYVYCIIAAGQERSFGPMGMGGRGDEVFTVSFDDLSMVVSNHPITKITVNRENTLLHEKVIEKVMKEFDSVLPVRFSTIVSDHDEIRRLFHERGQEFKDALREMDHKIELGVRGIWKNMDVIFSEIVQDNIEIKELKEKILSSGGGDIAVKMELGTRVEKALVRKKEREARKIINVLKKIAFDYKTNKTSNDKVFINAAFLVDKRQEDIFDATVEQLINKNIEKVKFIYTGPFPVFNFMNITI